LTSSETRAVRVSHAGAHALERQLGITTAK
jgi:hypothetical protein